MGDTPEAPSTARYRDVQARDFPPQLSSKAVNAGIVAHTSIAEKMGSNGGRSPQRLQVNVKVWGAFTLMKQYSASATTNTVIREGLFFLQQVGWGHGVHAAACPSP